MNSYYVQTPVHPKSKIGSKPALRKLFVEFLSSVDHPFILPIYQASIESLSAQPKTPTSTSLGVSLKSSGVSSDKVETLNLITFRPLSSNGSLKGNQDLLYSHY